MTASQVAAIVGGAPGARERAEEDQRRRRRAAAPTKPLAHTTALGLGDRTVDDPIKWY
jgi:hypothetical protein